MNGSTIWECTLHRIPKVLYRFACVCALVSIKYRFVCYFSHLHIHIKLFAFIGSIGEKAAYNYIICGSRMCVRVFYSHRSHFMVTSSFVFYFFVHRQWPHREENPKQKKQKRFFNWVDQQLKPMSNVSVIDIMDLNEENKYKQMIFLKILWFAFDLMGLLKNIQAAYSSITSSVIKNLVKSESLFVQHTYTDDLNLIFKVLKAKFW